MCVLRYLEVKNHDISNLSSNDLVYVWREKANVAKYNEEYKGFNVPLLQFFDKYKIFKFKKTKAKPKTTYQQRALSM